MKRVRSYERKPGFQAEEVGSRLAHFPRTQRDNAATKGNQTDEPSEI